MAVRTLSSVKRLRKLGKKLHIAYMILAYTILRTCGYEADKL
jgi:hypothetical protein